MNMENEKEVDKKPKRPKKFKIIEVEGLLGPLVSSWEEEQEARQQGYQHIYCMEKPSKKKKAKKKKWLSGRVRYGRYDGIFEVK